MVIVVLATTDEYIVVYRKLLSCGTPMACVPAQSITLRSRAFISEERRISVDGPYIYARTPLALRVVVRRPLYT